MLRRLLSDPYVMDITIQNRGTEAYEERLDRLQQVEAALRGGASGDDEQLELSAQQPNINHIFDFRDAADEPSGEIRAWFKTDVARLATYFSQSAGLPKSPRPTKRCSQ